MNVEQFAPYIIHNDKEIKGFFGEYRFLSNFHLCSVVFDGIMYQHSEGAYQAAKSTFKEEKELFTTMTPTEAKKAGRKVTLRSDWEYKKDVIMFRILTDKFVRNKDLTEKLKDTGEAYLEETNWWHDHYWGTSYPVAGFVPPQTAGQNQLGKLLMIIRDML